ncbi:SDR family NAD(P)-dependent oxidoreductase [Streptomyces sp. NPDC003688]
MSTSTSTEPRGGTELRGSTALVTGATSGIGRAVAQRLAERGARVVLHGRDQARGEAVVKEITGLGGTARFVGADLADAEDTLRLAAEAGAVDILVNNAGVYDLAPTARTDAAAFDRHIAVNTRAPFLLVGALAPAMAQRGRGAIITIGSSAARNTAPIGAAYAASKAGVEILTRYWATEFGGSGVRVNTVSPGPVRTEGISAVFGGAPDALDALDRINARGRAGEPEEIADVVAFLAGPESSYVNGAILYADGGEVSVFPG